MTVFSDPKNITCIWNEEELPYQCTESAIVHVHKQSNGNGFSNYQGIHCYQLHIKLYLIFFPPHVDGSNGDYKHGSDVTDQLLIRHILKCSDNAIYS